MGQRNTATRDRHRAAIARTKPPCALCLEPIDYDLKWPDPLCYVVDHVLPVVVHPELENELSNKQPAHNTCNRAKSDKLEAEQKQTVRVFITTRSW